MGQTWFTCEAGASADVAEIAIYDEIGGWGISAADFRDQLQALGDVKTINLRINSPGGQVFDGIAVHNMLARHPAKVTATVDGLAASIASVVLMAGDTIQMPENAMIMVHNPEGIVLGTAADMRDLADALDKIRNSIVSTYAGRTGMTAEAVIALLDAETWMTADEAKANGFADKVLPPSKIKNYFDVSKFAHPPADYKPPARNQNRQPPARQPPPAPEGGPTEEDVAAAAAGARNVALEIVAACNLAGFPEKAASYITSEKSLSQVMAELGELRAAADSRVDPSEVSARHRRPVAAADAVSWDKTISRLNNSQAR